MVLRSKGMSSAGCGVVLLLLWCGSAIGDLDDAAFLEADENQVPIHEAVAITVDFQVPNALPIPNTKPLPADARAWPAMKARGKPVPLDTVSYKAFDEVDARGLDKVQGYSSLSDLQDASVSLENLIVKPLNVETETLVAVLRPFRPQRLTRGVEAYWALSPLRVWRGGPLGQMQQAVDEALEQGDIQKASALQALYWRRYSDAVARRSVFEEQKKGNRRSGEVQDDRE